MTLVVTPIGQHHKIKMQFNVCFSDSKLKHIENFEENLWATTEMVIHSEYSRTVLFGQTIYDY